jgi:hypothetical protein
MSFYKQGLDWLVRNTKNGGGQLQCNTQINSLDLIFTTKDF